MAKQNLPQSQAEANVYENVYGDVRSVAIGENR